MKIRRKSEKPTVSVDGVPPLHTLITCTYQKLFKRDAGFMLVGGGGGGGSPPQPDNGLAPPTTPHAGHGHGTSDHKPHRHERGSSSWRVREGEKQTRLGGPHEGGTSRGAHEDLSPTQDLPNPPLSKRRKVKSTRYAEFAEKFSDEIVTATPKPEKRSRNITVEDALGNNAKEALIASIFYVFDTLGKEGLTASEVVAIMLEQSLPGLKEGGARHTVQVANVLRRSRHFLTMGNKQYLPCTVTEPEPRKGKNEKGSTSSSKLQGRMVCKLYDGSGWFCPRDAQAGLSLCTHHLDMINRGKMQASTSTAATVVVASLPSQQQQQQQPEDVQESSDSDQTDSEDIGPALAKWGRDRTPGSVPNQKRKMLSLCSIK